MDDKPRCLILFENSCKSKKTFETYIEFLDRFLSLVHKDFESLLLVPQPEFEELLQDYCIYLKKRVDNKEISPNSLPYFFRGIFNIIYNQLIL